MVWQPDKESLQKHQWGVTLDSKFFCFSIPVCKWRNSGLRNYPIHLKFVTVFLCYEKITVQFLVYTALIAHLQGFTKVFQYTTAYGGNFYKISFDTVIFQTINKNYISCLVSLLNSSFRKWVHNAEIMCVQEYTKE